MQSHESIEIFRALREIARGFRDSSEGSNPLARRVNFSRRMGPADTPPRAHDALSRADTGLLIASLTSPTGEAPHEPKRSPLSDALPAGSAADARGSRWPRLADVLECAAVHKAVVLAQASSPHDAPPAPRASPGAAAIPALHAGGDGANGSFKATGGGAGGAAEHDVRRAHSLLAPVAEASESAVPSPEQPPPFPLIPMTPVQVRCCNGGGDGGHAALHCEGAPTPPAALALRAQPPHGDRSLDAAATSAAQVPACPAPAEVPASDSAAPGAAAAPAAPATTGAGARSTGARRGRQSLPSSHRSSDDDRLEMLKQMLACKADDAAGDDLSSTGLPVRAAALPRPPPPQAALRSAALRCVVLRYATPRRAAPKAPPRVLGPERASGARAPSRGGSLGTHALPGRGLALSASAYRAVLRPAVSFF